jgi:hypothetical protein
MTEEKLCSVCEEPIPKKRIELVPDTTMCVECQVEEGDVMRYLGIREKVGTKHLGGCEDHIVKSKEQIEKFHEWRKKQKNKYPG